MKAITELDLQYQAKANAGDDDEKAPLTSEDGGRRSPRCTRLDFHRPARFGPDHDQPATGDCKSSEEKAHLCNAADDRRGDATLAGALGQSKKDLSKREQCGSEEPFTYITGKTF